MELLIHKHEILWHSSHQKVDSESPPLGSGHIDARPIEYGGSDAVPGSRHFWSRDACSWSPATMLWGSQETTQRGHMWAFQMTVNTNCQTCEWENLQMSPGRKCQVVPSLEAISADSCGSETGGPHQILPTCRFVSKLMIAVVWSQSVWDGPSTTTDNWSSDHILPTAMKFLFLLLIKKDFGGEIFQQFIHV